jgi:hypothetical protein
MQNTLSAPTVSSAWTVTLQMILTHDLAPAAIHIGLSIFDLAVNAAAGAAAASTGAHVNGDAVTNQVAYFGALGGVVKSGILNAIVLLALCTQKHWIYGIFVLATSTFGTALLTTYVMSEKIFEYGIPETNLGVLIPFKSKLTYVVSTRRAVDCCARGGSTDDPRYRGEDGFW